MSNKIKEKIGSEWIFCLISLFILLIVILINPIIFNSFAPAFINLLLMILPIFALVFVFIFVFDLLLTPQKIITLLGKESGVKGWLIAIILGILSSGPIYMWYPLIEDLQEEGMRNSLAIAFLYNRAIKIPLMPMIILYFGLPFLIVITILMIVFSIINGYIGEKMLIKMGGNK